MHILRCMGSKFCVKFQRAPLKFHTKFWTHTPQNTHFTVFYFGVWVTISLNCDVISLSETGPWCSVIFSVTSLHCVNPNKHLAIFTAYIELNLFHVNEKAKWIRMMYLLTFKQQILSHEIDWFDIYRGSHRYIGKNNGLTGAVECLGWISISKLLVFIHQNRAITLSCPVPSLRSDPLTHKQTV